MKKIFSMTGFAARKIQFQNSELTCEIRSLNSRYLETFVKLPASFKELEDRVKDIIRQRIDRGKITCTVAITSGDLLAANLQFNAGVVKRFRELLDNIRAAAGIDAPVQLADLLQFKEIFALEEKREIDQATEAMLNNLVNLTLDQLDETRFREGENLRQDLEERLAKIQRLNTEIRDLSKDNARVEFDKLYQRLLGMIDENKIDRNRLEMELGIISDRVDISEEVVRMESHLDLFRKNLAQGSPIGKKLNFILQEMHREANTMAAKNTLIDISHRIVAAKEDIERIREQVQNIE